MTTVHQHARSLSSTTWSASPRRVSRGWGRPSEPEEALQRRGAGRATLKPTSGRWSPPPLVLACIAFCVALPILRVHQDLNFSSGTVSFTAAFLSS
jgi:hypothetical protein